MIEFRGTTICAVKKDGKTAIAGDGQVTMSQSVIFKNNAVKVRRIYNGNVILGFAGSVSEPVTTGASVAGASSTGVVSSAISRNCEASAELVRTAPLNFA